MVCDVMTEEGDLSSSPGRSLSSLVKERASIFYPTKPSHCRGSLTFIIIKCSYLASSYPQADGGICLSRKMCVASNAIHILSLVEDR